MKKLISKINPLSSMSNSVAFMILLTSLLIMGDSVLSISDMKVVFDVNAHALFLGLMIVCLSIGNMALNSKENELSPITETKEEKKEEQVEMLAKELENVMKGQ
jgi:hypothetical protein